MKTPLFFIAHMGFRTDYYAKMQDGEYLVVQDYGNSVGPLITTFRNTPDAFEECTEQAFVQAYERAQLAITDRLQEVCKSVKSEPLELVSA